jgi:hypothetical protein
MTQSKEFSKAGHLYINPVMRKNFGIDLSDLLDNATSQQSSYLDQDLKDLFSSNFQENLAKDIIPEEYINNAFGTVPAHMSLEELIIDSDNALAEQDLENIDTSASATNFTPEEMTQLQGLEGAGYDIQIGNEIEKQNENEYDKIIFHPNGSATLTKEGQADLALDSITTYMQISNLKEMQNNGTISALDQKTLNDYFTAYGTKATVPIVIFHNNGTATVTEEGKETKTLDRDSIKTIIDGIEMMRNWNTITAYQQALLNDYSAANEATITAGQAVSHQEQETPPVQAAKGRTATPTRPTTATTGIDTRQIGY